MNPNLSFTRSYMTTHFDSLTDHCWRPLLRRMRVGGRSAFPTPENAATLV